MNSLLRKKRAALLGANRWFVPSGLEWTDVLAAYQFKAANDANDSKTDLTGNGYNLTYSGVSWTASGGLSAGKVTQDALTALGTGVKTQIVYYSNYADTWTRGDDYYTGGYYLTHMNLPWLMLRQYYSFKIHDTESEYYGPYGGRNLGITYVSNNGDGSSGMYEHKEFLTSSQKAGSSGVAAMTINGSNRLLYKNGVNIATTAYSQNNWTSPYNPNAPTASNEPVCPCNDSTHTVNILAAAFFKVVLNPDQIAEVTAAMQAIQ